MSGVILRCNGCGASMTHGETCRVAPAAFVDGQLRDRIRELEAEVRRLQAWIIAAVNDGPDRDDAELSCQWLCPVVCAGPCEGVSPADPTGEGEG